MKLVVCDDDRVIRFLLEAVLSTRGGHQVIATGDPDEVRSLVTEHQPDLVLLDYLLPGRTGLEVVKELRADPVTAGVPVVFLTGLADLPDESELPELGISGLITKPFDTTTLAHRLEQLLS